jgi:DNA mismatch repair protein MutS
LKAKEWNGDLIFLHEAGPAPPTAATASRWPSWPACPPGVVGRARQVLERLETRSRRPRQPRRPAAVRRRRRAGAQVRPSKVEEALQALDPDGMSPREAMDALYRLKGLLA